MDIQMPEMDGLTATTILRDELNCRIPIIAMTANAMKIDLQKSTDVGMTAHINKPIEPEYFYQVLAEIILTSSPVLSSNSLPSTTQSEDIATNHSIDKLLVMDQQNAMQMLFVDEETFTSILQDFVDKGPVINTLATLIENRAYQDINKIIHDALPALTYIGAYNLAMLAKSLEATIFNKKQENNQSFNEQLKLFNQAMVSLVLLIKKQLAYS
jgi:two-component system sensor histidine kinase/response regulator